MVKCLSSLADASSKWIIRNAVKSVGIEREILSGIHLLDLIIHFFSSFLLLFTRSGKYVSTHAENRADYER